MTLSTFDRKRAQFASGEEVAFQYRNETYGGTIVRTNPKRALVQSGDSNFQVPYQRLLAISDDAKAREARIESIYNQAISLIKQHGLSDWNFIFDHAANRAGCCAYHTKTISISFNLATKARPSDIQNTLLHEIAHALVGPNHHHDEIWKNKAIEIGCDGSRTHSLKLSTPRWNMTCENKCWKQTAEKRNARLICRTCGGKIHYTPFTPPNLTSNFETKEI